MRFFIALDLPEESKQELQVVQQKLKELIPQLKLTDNDKLHLTIAFIGEQPSDLKPNLIEAMTHSTKDVPPFSVTPSYIDGFPHLHTAKTLWVGVKGDIDKLFLLRHRIKDSLQDLDLGVDQRRYVPHIAIAKTPSNFSLTQTQEEELQNIMNLGFDPIQVSSLKLYESIPNEGFHSHNTLSEIKLSAIPPLNP